MRKIIISTLLAGILLLAAGCGAAGRSEGIKLASEEPAVSQSPAEPPIEPPTESPIEPPVGIPASPTPEQRLGNAAKDAYSGIEIDAFIRERKAILPGFAVPITVIVKNTGNETIDYIHGSGSYTTPEAVFINVDRLQTVRPADHLGPTTMDFRTSELKPGDQLEFVMYAMAIEPNAKFNTYAIEMYNKGNAYIAEKAWDELEKEFPDLIPANPGSYQGQAYFLYYVRNASGSSDFTKEPTGYAEYDFTIAVS